MRGKARGRPTTSISAACPNGLKLPSGLLKNLPDVLDKITVVRSLAAWDAVHGRAQYYIQTGHPLNLALAKEVPAIGAVVCHELAKYRKPADSLPAFIAMNMAGNQAGLINQGFLSAEFGPMSSVGRQRPAESGSAEGDGRDLSAPLGAVAAARQHACAAARAVWIAASPITTNIIAGRGRS